MLANFVIGMVGFVGFILFILFIRRSATYLNDQRVADGARRFLIFVIAVFVGTMIFILAAIVLESEAILALFGLGIFVIFVVSVVWYLRLIQSLIRAIDAGMAG